MSANAQGSSAAPLAKQIPSTKPPAACPRTTKPATTQLATKPATNPLPASATSATTALNACNTPPATTPDPLQDHPALAISDIQRQALDLLAAGRSDADVATDLDLHRTTIYRWRTQHPRFIAELSQLTSTRRSAVVTECLDLALEHVLRRLNKKGSGSVDLAIKLLCSPRFSRLAADASAPRTLRDVVSQIAAATTMAPTEADLPAVLNQVQTSIAAPIPEDPPESESESTTEEDPQPQLQTRPVRPEILAALRACGCIGDETHVDTIIRRPDLDPFDVYYIDAIPNRPETCTHFLRSGLYRGEPSGITHPLNPQVVARMIDRQTLTQLGHHNLVGCQARLENNRTIAITRNNQVILNIPYDDLWRNLAVYRPSSPPAQATAA